MMPFAGPTRTGSRRWSAGRGSPGTPSGPKGMSAFNSSSTTIPSPAPEKAAARIRVPADFDLRLVAAEPLIEKPISMDWDPQGRLWVAETPEYPNGRKINRNDEIVAPWRDHDPKTYSTGIDSRPAR